MFASHYQFVVCQDPFAAISDDWHWGDESMKLGFTGARHFRIIGTEADSNQHWIELVASDYPPNFAEWQRVTCAHFQTSSGNIHVMPIFGGEPVISAHVSHGYYALYVAGQNLGVDQHSLGEISDTDFASRKDLEWYRIFLVPGAPDKQGRLSDAPMPIK